jgi:hypothetical protein
MRRVDLLITSSREQTESQNFSPDTGIQDSQFIQFLNDAQGQSLFEHSQSLSKRVPS